ncbi:hypothetical protein [Atlantibacter hermannii]|uniref:hypothetical protein n=1 Tax=Atlantibacter hermannii TaxID=565 RepID=UPI00289A0EEE|nr:hypothetical protein [Atlantibacter hermannii]
MTINERVPPKRLAEIIARAEVCDDSVLTDYRDIESIARELQQYRAGAEPVYQYQAFTFVENSDGEQEKFWFWSDCNERFYTACKGTKRILYAAPQVTSVPDVSDLEKVLRFIESLPVPTKGAGINGKRLYNFIVSCRAAMLTAAPAVQAEQTKRLIGWRTADYTEETSDPEMAKNWAAVVGVLPVFEGDINTRLQAEQLSGNTEQVSQPTLPKHSPCADAPDHIWLQTAGEWPASGEFGELTWSCDNQHPDDTLYIRADLVVNSSAIPDGWTCSDKANAALVMLGRIDTLDPVDDDRIEGIKRIIRELAAAPKQEDE